jgi:predicted oxidoreductase
MALVASASWCHSYLPWELFRTLHEILGKHDANSNVIHNAIQKINNKDDHWHWMTEKSRNHPIWAQKWVKAFADEVQMNFQWIIIGWPIGEMRGADLTALNATSANANSSRKLEHTWIVWSSRIIQNNLKSIGKNEFMFPRFCTEERRKEIWISSAGKTA